MKQMTCVEMGGPSTCTVVISGDTPEEMVDNGMLHLKADHPQMAEDMKKMPKEDIDKWMKGFRKKWDAAPEM